MDGSHHSEITCCYVRQVFGKRLKPWTATHDRELCINSEYIEHIGKTVYRLQEWIAVLGEPILFNNFKTLNADLTYSVH